MSKASDKPNGEEIVSVALAPEVKRDLNKVSLYNSRTMRRQAAIYIQRGVARDVRRIVK